ncbi:hypothetical protein [Rubrolithibacter danxiaensis]|uniref:hypothetical protein n=1 Tax=Rubrolithibacter danxiaensis TaxID=3390805 RepID=UPI003BF7FFDC
MRKTLLFIILLFITVLAVAILYFSNIATGSKQNTRALAFIPADAAMVMEFKNDPSFYEIFRNYRPFDAVIGSQKSAELLQLKNIFIENTQLHELLNGQDIYFSFHPASTGIELLWLLTLHTDYSAEDIEKILLKSQNTSFKKDIFEGETYYEIEVKDFNKPFYLHLSRGIAAGSFSKNLFLQALDKDVKKIDREFITEINNDSQKNSNSPLNLFINHNTLPLFLGEYFKEKPQSYFNLLKQLNGFSSLNMNFRTDVMMFNGLTSTDTSEANYLNVFLHQQPVPNTIKKIIPSGTANFILFGISNTDRFSADLNNLFQKRGEADALKKQIERINSKTGINTGKDLQRLWGKEFGLIQAANREKVAAIKTTNGQELGRALDPLSTSYSPTIRHFDNSNLLYYYFGDALKEFTRPFYTIIDNYLIAGKTPSAVQQFLNDYSANKLLIKEADFTNFNQYLATKSTVLFFIHTRNSERIRNASLKNSFSNKFKDNDYDLKSFYGLSFQLSSENDRFYTNLYTEYKSPEKTEKELAWKFKMNGRNAITPQVVLADNGQKLILVQDNINNLYALSENGNKQWSTQLDGRIQGKVFQLSDSSLLFNTSRRLYRIRTTGNSFPSFPIDLTEKATNSLSITSTDTADLQILIPCTADIIAYTVTGKQLPAWKKHFESSILEDIKIIDTEPEKRVLVGTESGAFYFYTYQGNLAEKLQDPKRRKIAGHFYLDLKEEKKDSKIVTTDTSGTLLNFHFNGTVTDKSFGSWPSEHFFYLMNINREESKELIYLYTNQLEVYDSDNTLLYTYEFPYPITEDASFFPVNNTMYQIGIYCGKNKSLYLFNDDGTLVKGFPFKGEPNFSISTIGNKGERYLICGTEGNHISAFKL